MLIQMANREEWLDVHEMMARVEEYKAHLELNADLPRPMVSGLTVKVISLTATAAEMSVS